MLRSLEEAFYLVIGTIACFSPVALIIAVAVQAGRIRDLRQQVRHQEEGLRSLGDQTLRLHHRLQSLEAAPPQLAPPQQAAPAQPDPAAPEHPAAPAAPAPVEPAAPEAPGEGAAPAVTPATAEPPSRWAPPVEQPQPQTPLQATPAEPVEGPASPQPAPAETAATPAAPAAADAGGPPPPNDGGPTPAPADQPPAGPPPAQPKAPIAWEEWIGVRGAAALGGIVLVVAGLYFFKYSMDHGLIAPPVRFAIGMVVGLVGVVLAELKLRPKYEIAAGWVGGAGIAVLYISSWAGRSLYDLYPTSVATVLMVSVTAACVAISLRRSSMPIAILGLCGGFVTPLALSTGSDHPIPLFGYLLVLDLAILWVAIRKRWAWLAAAALVATLFYEIGWIGLRMDDPRRWIGAVVLVLFAGVFAFAPLRETDEESSPLARATWRWVRGLAILAPCLIGLGLGFASDLSAHLPITGAQSLLLGAGAAFLARREGMGAFAVVAALVLQASLVGTLTDHTDSAFVAWTLAAIALGVAFVFHVPTELGGADARTRGLHGSLAASLGALALGFVALAAPPVATAAAATLLALAPIALCRISARSDDWRWLQTAALGLSGLGLGLIFASRSGDTTSLPEPTVTLGLLLLVAFASHLAGVLPKAPAARRSGDHGAVLLSLAAIVAIAAVDRRSEHPLAALYVGSWLALLSVVFAAARSALGGWLVVAGFAAALGDLYLASVTEVGHGVLFGAMIAKVVLLVSAPFLFRSLGESRWAWRAAGASALFFLLPLRSVYLELAGVETQGLLPVGLAVLYLAGAFALRRRTLPEASALSARIWLVGAAAALITIAIPMQLEKQWITIGWALQVVVFTALWRRYDHPGLKYTAAGLAAIVFIRLALNPYVLDYHLRSAWRVLNWISYTYLVPAIALLAAHALMNPLEGERRRPWEPGPGGKDGPARPLVAPTFGGMAIVLVFLWANLMVFDFFATGPNLTIPTDRMPARDLTTSIVWAVYAVALLAAGLLRRTKGLRYASLALLLLTCLKVFLYDLGNLEDLYRVASLVGLALTLIVISLVYKRFVFNDPPESSTPAPQESS
ncbi:MAG: DUF2339 domain-containing protein [Deltaproteobacteria bacterium]|nr:DUF2339 domain-containing protein [Deltaproteobacteria bacterium]